MSNNPNRFSDPDQAQYQAWLEKHDAENQANLERTGRATFEDRGRKTIDATEKIGDIDPDEIFNMSDEEIMNLNLSPDQLEDVIGALSANLQADIAKLEKPKADQTNNSGESKEEETETPENNSSEEAARTLERAKRIERARRNSKFRRVFKKKILPIILATAISIAGFAGFAGIANHFNNNDQSRDSDQSKISTKQASSAEELTDVDDGEQLGIKDGYNEKGMYCSQNKAGKYDFANATEVASVCDNDECEMVKYASRNQVECMADYMANLPLTLQPEDFKGLNILETEEKLQSLSDEEFEAIQTQFEQTVDDAFTRRITVNGEQLNAYMRLIDPSKPATHDNMELVECTTNESNLEVTEFYWIDSDGNEIGSMDMKIIPVRDESGQINNFKGCMQVINPVGSTHIYAGMKTVSEISTVSDTIDSPGTSNIVNRSKGENTHAGENQQIMGTTENTKGDTEREATVDNSASNSNPGSEVNEIITDTTETNANHPSATRADNANTIKRETVDTSNQRGAGDNVNRTQEDLADIVNGGGV